jgi:methylenetetrahydrofolate reductase (NADPH)
VENDLTTSQRAAIRHVLEHAKFELIPLKNVLDQSAFLPDGATVSVTASPVKALEDTIDLAAELQHRGFDVIPHLSARTTRDHAHLERLVTRLDDLQIRKVFVIGGDADDPGEFFDAGSLLKAMADLGVVFDEIGIGSYPEGHHVFDDETARLALHDKQRHATYMTTQMCFDGDAVTSWLAKMRADGIVLPAVVGVHGVADRLKLMRISARIGVGRSMKFLSRHRGLLRSFIEPGRYSPDELLEDMAATLDDPTANVAGVHIYTFNQVETTERWRQAYLEALA